MIPPVDPFAQKFDTIEVDPARAPGREAIESAMAHIAPHDELLTASAAAPELPQAGFYLLNDANGRFAVDRDLGVIAITDDDILYSERNTVHGVRLRVVEASGASYELDMQLRITGRVPQMVGGEEFAAIAGLTDETVLTAARVPVLAAPAEATVVETTPPTPQPEQIAWTRFAVAQGHVARTPRTQPRRSFIVSDLPTTSEAVVLSFDGLPPGFASHLPWSL